MFTSIEFCVLDNCIENYESLPIVRLFKNINDALEIKTGDGQLINDIEIINGNSTEYISTLQKEQIGNAITSPPYYNAREYSQWSNMLLYYIDVLINTKAIFNCLHPNGSYLYNIGDVVCEDNVYVRSHMSNRRLSIKVYSSPNVFRTSFETSSNVNKSIVEFKKVSSVE